MKTIEQVVAESEIRDVHARYCRSADRCDFELYRTCFHPDAKLVFSFFSGGVDEFIAMAEEGLASYMLTTHFTGNSLVEVDGDSARAEYYTMATHRMPADDKGPERDYVASVRYVDRLERRGGEWRIARRRCVLDWARSDPVPAFCDGAKTGEARRDRSDACYSD
ncbi:MAG: nuclear transport factor 2 family protein [Novosphingobium sp.]|nr:nuclear transport factor 2 family protein [Novosphingobium sp.]